MTPVRPLRLVGQVPWFVADVLLAGAAVLDAFVNRAGGAWRLDLALVAAAALLARRRLPLVTLAATLPALFLSNIFLAPEIALFTVASSGRRRAWLALGGLGVFLGQFLPIGDWSSVSSWTLQVVYAVLFMAAPLSLGLLVQARQTLVRQVEELTAGQAREQRLLTDNALAVERAHLAREMHDVVAHNVSLIALQAGALRMTASDPAAAESARTIRSLSVRTLDELRYMVGVLRAGGADGSDLSPQPTLSDLPRLVASSGLTVDLEVSPAAAQSCTRPVERAIYRMVQEGLTNVNKHAAGARTAVVVALSGPWLSVTVANEPPPARPPGAALPPGGHGLIGLRERAALLGGSLDVQATPRGGFVLRATFPTDQQRRDRTVLPGAGRSSSVATPDPTGTAELTQPHPAPG